jgi:hypothetical protein
MFRKPIFLQCSLFLLLLGLVSLAYSATGNLNILSNSSQTSISELAQLKQASKIVYLRGKVGDRAPFLGGGAYQLLDRTGEIWVTTQKTLPSRGDEVAIKGQIEYKAIAIGSQQTQEIYIIELER